jgi:hypothetical protein
VSEDQSASAIQSRMASLHLYQEQQGAEIAKLESVSNLLSAALAAILLAFVYLFFNNVGNNFSQERIADSVQKHVPEMLPDLANGALQIVSRVYPTYSELIQKEGLAAMPELSKAVESESDKLIEGLHKGTEARLHKAIIDSFVGPNKPLRKAFPKVAPADVNKALNAFASDVEEDLVAVTNDFLMAHIGEVIALKRTIDSFDTKGLPSDETALSKRLVHSLLGLLDLEVTEAK